MRTYYVYMLQCFDGTFYTGVTNNVERRFREHCDGHDPDSYTHTRRPLLLVHVSEFDRPIDAIAWEKRLKGWSHKKKRSLIRGDANLLIRLSANHQSP